LYLNASKSSTNAPQEIIPDSSKFCRNFLDLLEKIFVYDPAERITAKQALQHPWFKEGAAPDDGTEAAKIRINRLQSQAAANAAMQTAAPPRHNAYH
jgi:dual-specificity kinase